MSIYSDLDRDWYVDLEAQHDEFLRREALDEAERLRESHSPPDSGPVSACSPAADPFLHDYVLLGNDGSTCWRIGRYTERAEDFEGWTHDREAWTIWRWTGDLASVSREWWTERGEWDFFGGMFSTRREAIDAALRRSS